MAKGDKGGKGKTQDKASGLPTRAEDYSAWYQ